MSQREHSILTDSSSEGWDLWDQFVVAMPSGTLYHTSPWLRALTRGMGLDIRVHVLQESGTIRAGAVIRHGGRFGLNVARKPWATAYNGIVHDPHTDDEHIPAFVNELLRHYAHVRLVHAPSTQWQAKDFGMCDIRRKTTPMLDTTDLGGLWESFDRHARQRVRKAENAGVRVAQTDDADAFYDLYVLTYERQGLSMPVKRDAFCRTLQLACESQAMNLYLASTKESESAAALLVGADAKRAYFMLAASHPEHRKTDAVTLLWWRAIQECAATHNEIDLVGTGTPEIERFKRSFSPRLDEYLDVLVHSPGFAGMAIRGYEAARTLTTWARGGPKKSPGQP